MRRALSGCAAVGMLLAVAVPAAANQELPKLTIGTIFPLSGPQAAFGKEAMRGVELATEIVTKEDPELGPRLSFLAGDDLSTVKDATAAATKLAAERAHVLIGSLTSAGSAAVAQVAKAQQLPMIAPLATQTTLPTGLPVLRSCFDETQQAEALATFALTVLGLKQAATLRDDTLSAKAFTDRFQTVFKAGGGQIVADEVYDVGSDDFTGPLKKLASAGATLIATPAPYPTAAGLMRQARRLDAKLTFLGGEGWDTAELGKQAGAAAKGHYFVSHFAVDDPDPKTQAFVAAFTAKYGRAPGAIAALTFDAVTLVVDAFKRANANMKGPLTQALARTRGFAGVTGSLAFGPAGETLKAGVVKRAGETGAKFRARIEPKAPGA